MPRRFDLLVFDWDGTLIDSAGAIASCIQLAAGDLGLTVPDDERARHVIGLGLGDALAYAVPDLPVAEYGRMAERYRHHFLARDADLPLFAGVRELLRRLQARGHRLAIATGKSRVGLARGIEHLGLDGIFDATRCADQCAPKPAPDMLIELMDELVADRERTLMIGDTAHDLTMAANAGVAAVAVGYGAHPPVQLAALGPLALAQSPAELAAWLDEHA
ncbi:MAG: HAD-IA family hydrolase [Betaproteobacteria bacterium]|jgi:phosphoglycolate phosphatase|nr:HAD-IA family hydrolase [Betaproteobacteria bacterium]